MVAGQGNYDVGIALDNAYRLRASVLRAMKGTARQGFYNGSPVPLGGHGAARTEGEEEACVRSGRSRDG